MPINTISFATALTAELDKATEQGAVTGFMADNVLRTKFVGAHTVLIPSVELDGLGDYDHDTGFTRGAVTLTNQSCVLSQDRARSFQIDREDNDETGIATLAGELMGEFVRTCVVPEIDAYVLSKTAGVAVTKSHTVSVGQSSTLKADVYGMFTTAALGVQNVVGFDEPLVCFVDPTVWEAMQQSSALSHQLVVSDFRKGNVNFKVNSINGIPVLPVPASRMKTAFTFYDGIDHSSETNGVDQSAGGFAATANAKNIGMLILPKRAVMLVKKTEKVRTFSPDQNQTADAYKLDYRTYYDAFVRKSMENAIYAYVYQ